MNTSKIVSKCFKHCKILKILQNSCYLYNFSDFEKPLLKTMIFDWYSHSMAFLNGCNSLRCHTTWKIQFLPAAFPARRATPLMLASTENGRITTTWQISEIDWHTKLLIDTPPLTLAKKKNQYIIYSFFPSDRMGR